MSALCVGCFDPLHYGHILLFREAKKLSKFLVVGVTDDENVGKPGRPHLPVKERISALQELKCVDMTIECATSLQALKMITPNFFVLGSDYVGKMRKEDEEWCKDHHIAIWFSSGPKYSSTALIDDFLRRS